METERDWTCVHAISSDPPVIECNVHYIKLPGTQEDIDAFLCDKKKLQNSCHFRSFFCWMNSTVCKKDRY